MSDSNPHETDVGEYYQYPEKNVDGKTGRKRFALTLIGSTAFLVFVFLLTFSVLNVGALTLSGTGGFAIEADEIFGTQVQFYPDPVETAACEADFDDPRVGSLDEQAVVALTADVDDILFPADSELTLTKDIPTPGLMDMDGVRFEVSRGETIDDPDFPPQAPSRSDILSVGDVTQSYIVGIDFNELVIASGVSGGYSDLRFERTAPILEGEGGYEIDVFGHGFFDYSQVDVFDYPVSPGIREDRYIEGVSLQNLDNQNTGPEGGYEDYTELNNTGEAPDDGTLLLERGASETMTVTGVGSDPLFGPVDDVRDEAVVDVEVPDPVVGDDSDEAFIDDVTFDTISDTGTGDDGGYRERWDITTDPLDKGDDVQITVTGEKKSGTFTDANSPGDPGRDSGADCGKGCTLFAWTYAHGFGNEPSGMGDGGSFWANVGRQGGFGDFTDWTATGDVTEPALAQPGDDVDIGMCIAADNTDDDEQAVINIGRAFIDWEGDGNIDENLIMGVAAASEIEDGGELDTDCTTRPVEVPEDVEPGTGLVRYMTNAATIEEEDDPPPDSDFSFDDGGFGEANDYSIHVQPRSRVSAFFDWTQDGNFETEVNLADELDREGSFSHTEDIEVPDDAVSGSTTMRVLHRNQPGEMNPEQGDYIGEAHDYTAQVEEARTDSGVYAYFDWERDGEFDDEQFLGSTTNNDGEFDISGSVDVPDDAQAGSTIMRVVHQQDGWGVGEPDAGSAPDPGAAGVNGEFHDYTVNVEPDGSYVRAWVDWDGDGFVEEADFGTTNEGFGEGTFENEGDFTLTDEIENPGGLNEPVHTLRVTHKQALPDDIAGEGPPEPDEGFGGWTGETLDFTLVTDPSIDPDDGNLTLGRGSFTVTELEARDIQIQGDVLIDDRFTDNTPENPKFGPEGEFVLGGNQARLTDIRGVVHFVSFTFFQFPDLDLSISYLDEDEIDGSEYLFADAGCGDPFPD